MARKGYQSFLVIKRSVLGHHGSEAGKVKMRLSLELSWTLENISRPRKKNVNKIATRDEERGGGEKNRPQEEV